MRLLFDRLAEELIQKQGFQVSGVTLIGVSL